MASDTVNFFEVKINSDTSVFCHPKFRDSPQSPI